MSEAGATTARDRVLRSLADDILALAGGCRRIAIDGVDGSGKTTFTRELTAALSGTPVVVIHLDDFLNLREVRHRRGRDSAEGFWLDSYDYDAVRRDVLEPLGTGGNGAYRAAARDHRRDTPVTPALQYAPENCVVFVEGMFLHRDELKDLWGYSLFLDVPFSETARRMAVRDGSNPDPEHPSMHRYVGGQRLYFASAQPWLRATRVIDNTNPLEPRILAAGTRAGD